MKCVAHTAYVEPDGEYDLPDEAIGVTVVPDPKYTSVLRLSWLEPVGADQ